MTFKFLRDDGQFASFASTSGTGGAIQTVYTASMVSSINLTTSPQAGPSVSQGTVGTWYVSGQITYFSTTAGTVCLAQLWDGTNTIATQAAFNFAASVYVPIAISGFITNPAGNLNIAAWSNAAGFGGLVPSASSFTTLGNASTITAVRIG